MSDEDSGGGTGNTLKALGEVAAEESVKPSQIQRGLHRFGGLREYLATGLVYCSLRLIGTEVKFREVAKPAFDSVGDDVEPDFGKAKEGETLLATAKDRLAAATARRAVVIDKCKTLLTLGSLFLALGGFLLPREAVYETFLIRFLAWITVLLFLHAVALMLLFFVTGADMEVVLDQTDIELEKKALQRALARSYVQCRRETDKRADYLVEVYRAARFSFFGAFFLASVLFSINFLFGSREDPTEQLVRKLRADPELLKLLTGPPGEKGDAGVPGAPGAPGRNATVDESAIAARILAALPEHKGMRANPGDQR